MPGRGATSKAATPGPAPARPPAGWDDLLPAGRTAVMGVVNVTPDSFSDGGRFLDPSAAVAHALALAGQGADILDIGGESTRPGAQAVPEAAELERVVPVVRALKAAGCAVPISIDTTKAAVARAAVEAGADIVNDVSALGADSGMPDTVAALGVPVVLMHMRGTPRTMQAAPAYGNVVGEVRRFLERRVARAVAAGVRRAAIAVDPGIGFGKTARHNLLLLAALPHLAQMGLPVVVGTSRKAFIGRVLGAEVEERGWGTAATVAWAIAHGARVVRVHDVAEMAQVARMTDAIRRAPADGAEAGA
jgi:dihydropteroate synthase